MSVPRAVVFDAVGTLITPASDVGSIYAAAGAQHGSTLGVEEITSRFRLARNRVFSADNSEEGLKTSDADQRQKWHQLVTSVFDDVPEPEPLFEKLWTTFSEPLMWRVYPDAQPAITELLQAGFIVAIGSNFDSRLHRIVAGLPELHDIQHIFTSAELGHAKPSPRFFRGIETAISVPASECLMIGDDEICDRIGATDAGWTGLLLDRQRATPDIANGIIRDLTELPGP